MLNNRPDTKFVAAVREIASGQKLGDYYDARPIIVVKINTSFIECFLPSLMVVACRCPEIVTRELCLALDESAEARKCFQNEYVSLRANLFMFKELLGDYPEEEKKADSTQPYFRAIRRLSENNLQKLQANPLDRKTIEAAFSTDQTADKTCYLLEKVWKSSETTMVKPKWLRNARKASPQHHAL